MHASRIALVVASALGMICTFLPWVSVPFIGAVYGTRGDGWITFAVCAGAMVCAVVGERRSALALWAILISALCGITASLIGVLDIARVDNALVDNPFGAAVSIGPGLYLLVVAGAVTAILPAILTLRRSPAPPMPPRVVWSRPDAWPPNG
jgi:hypothetical protein